MCDFASTSYLVVLPIYSGTSHFIIRCVCGGEGGGGRERGQGGRILFRCSTRGEVGVGWSLLFLGIPGWEGEDH